MTKGRDASLQERIKKTYYACARFVRLAELFYAGPVLALDVDAVVRQSLPVLPINHDFYLHHITGRKARYLAGGLWINPTEFSRNFLKEYCEQLVLSEDKNLYIIAGGIFTSKNILLNNKITVPDTLFKIVLITDNNNNSKIIHVRTLTLNQELDRLRELVKTLEKKHEDELLETKNKSEKTYEENINNLSNKLKQSQDECYYLLDKLDQTPKSEYVLSLEEENKYLSDRSTSLYAELNKSKKLVNKLNKVILKLQHQKSFIPFNPVN
jgi:hypothetical protein